MGTLRNSVLFVLASVFGIAGAVNAQTVPEAITYYQYQNMYLEANPGSAVLGSQMINPLIDNGVLNPSASQNLNMVTTTGTISGTNLLDMTINQVNPVSNAYGIGTQGAGSNPGPGLDNVFTNVEANTAVTANGQGVYGDSSIGVITRVEDGNTNVDMNALSTGFVNGNLGTGNSSVIINNNTTQTVELRQ